MKNKLMIVIIFLLFAPNNLPSQTDSTKKEIQHAFGVQYNQIAGYGLTYRFPTQIKQMSIQADIGFYSIDNKTNYSVGVEYLYRLARLMEIDATIGPGIGLFKSSSVKSNFHIGFGLGLEYRIPPDVYDNYFILFGRIYYPTYY